MIDRIHEADGRVVIEARSGRDQVACPGCGIESARVHGRYHRRLADTALAGRPVVIQLLMRRLVCRQDDCARVTFAEQIPGLTTPHSRYSPVGAENPSGLLTWALIGACSTGTVCG